MAHIDTLVIVDGSPVSYATLEALLNDHFKTSLKECVFSGTDVLNTKKETYTKALCHPNSPYSMEQLASMLKIMKPGGTVIFYAPDAVQPFSSFECVYGFLGGLAASKLHLKWVFGF